MYTKVDMGKAANSILLRFSGYIEHRSAKDVSLDGQDDSGRWKQPWGVKGNGEWAGEHSRYLTRTNYVSVVPPYITITFVTSPIWPTRQVDNKCAFDSQKPDPSSPRVQLVPGEVSIPSHLFTKLTCDKLSNHNWVTPWLLIHVSCNL